MSQAAKFARLALAVEMGVDAAGAFGRYMKQADRSPRSAFYDAKAHRGFKHRRAVGPGSYSELDIKVGELLDLRPGITCARRTVENSIASGEHLYAKR